MFPESEDKLEFPAPVSAGSPPGISPNPPTTQINSPGGKGSFGEQIQHYIFSLHSEFSPPEALS